MPSPSSESSASELSGRESPLGYPSPMEDSTACGDSSSMADSSTTQGSCHSIPPVPVSQPSTTSDTSSSLSGPDLTHVLEGGAGVAAQAFTLLHTGSTSSDQESAPSSQLQNPTHKTRPMEETVGSAAQKVQLSTEVVLPAIAEMVPHGEAVGSDPGADHSLVGARPPLASRIALPLSPVSAAVRQGNGAIAGVAEEGTGSERPAQTPAAAAAAAAAALTLPAAGGRAIPATRGLYDTTGGFPPTGREVGRGSPVTSSIWDLPGGVAHLKVHRRSGGSSAEGCSQRGSFERRTSFAEGGFDGRSSFDMTGAGFEIARSPFESQWRHAESPRAAVHGGVSTSAPSGQLPNRGRISPFPGSPVRGGLKRSQGEYHDDGDASPTPSDLQAVHCNGRRMCVSFESDRLDSMSPRAPPSLEDHGGRLGSSIDLRSGSTRAGWRLKVRVLKLGIIRVIFYLNMASYDGKHVRFFGIQLFAV